MRDHRMIEDGDRVLIAFSGGKDSSVLTQVLSEKRKIIPITFELLACHLTTDLASVDPRQSEQHDRFFNALDIELTRRHVPILARLDPKFQMNCFFCAMQRRKTLLSVAKALNCTKIAFGHHLDDIIETLLMNMFYNGKIATMPIRLELDNHDVTIVRPLGLTKERDISTYAAQLGLIDDSPPCPYGESGRRARVKRLITELAREDPRIRDNLSAALGRVKLDYLKEKLRETGDTTI